MLYILNSFTVIFNSFIYTFSFGNSFLEAVAQDSL